MYKMGINHTHLVSKKLFPYEGAKSNMVKTILPLIPVHKVYLELFAGSAVVYFSKPLVDVNVINDKQSLILNFYKCAKLQPNKLIRRIDTLMHAEYYFQWAKEVLADDNAKAMDKAVAFWALGVMQKKNTDCYEISINKQKGVVREGRNCKMLNKAKRSLKESIDKLKSCQVLNRDFRDCLKLFKTSKDLFIYIDPPYINTTQGTHYSPFSEADYIELLDYLSTTNHKFMLSSYPNDILAEYIARNNWEVRQYTKALSAGGVKHGAKRKTKTELLVMNYKINDLFS